MLAAGADAMSKWFGGGESPEDNEEMFKRFTIDQNKKYGEGGYGATFAAHDTKTGQDAAVKVIDTRRMRLEAIRKEVFADDPVWADMSAGGALGIRRDVSGVRERSRPF